ncbi:MAG: Epoxide hydrolase [Rhodospirillales bacterium]|nr:Epoxide hydrolase [Rhodospirillales bacterium]
MRENFTAEPFKVAVSDAVLDDLKTRLARTRWPIEAKATPWQYGTDLTYLKSVLAHWHDAYDWRLWEEKLNRFPQYKAIVGGRKLHFIMERGSGDNPLPLVLTHGWPGSVVEFLDVIEPLAHPERFGGNIEDAFTVIVPSLPGYGFSDPPDAPITPRDIAGLWRELMVDVLGCERYVAQGGDWGSTITSWLAFDHPEHLAAIHLNMQGLLPFRGEGVPPMTEEELNWLKEAQESSRLESAYQQIQGTKPQTLSYGLTDSPAGLAGWILEKFHGWTIPGSAEPPPFDLDRLLTNVMLYWLGGINASTWLYVALIDSNAFFLNPGETIAVPTGLFLFPNDLIPPPPDSWTRRVYNVTHRRDGASGGHFAVFENGPLLVDDMRAFFRNYR